MSISGIKNNSVVQLAQNVAGTATKVASKLSPETLGKMTQLVDTISSGLKSLQGSIQGGDSFGQAPAGGAPGTSPQVQQFAQMLQMMQDMLNPQSAGQSAGGAPQGTVPPMAMQNQMLNNIREEQGALMSKIAEGVQSGKITPQELGKLMQGVNQLSKMTELACADGNLSMEEAHALESGSLNNILNYKSAAGNADTSDFAAFNPATQNQARQLASLGQGLLQGSVSNNALGRISEEQGAFANAQTRVSSPEDAEKLLKVQQSMASSIQFARMTNL